MKFRAMNGFRDFTRNGKIHIDICKLVFTLMLVALSIPSIGDQPLIDASGRLTYPDGRPAVGIKLLFETYVCGQNSCIAVKTEAVTDKSGNYMVKLKPGNTWAQASYGNYLLCKLIRIGEDNRSVYNDLVFSRSTLVIGEVTDASTSLPIEGAKVSLFASYGADTCTDKTGCFLLKVLPVDGLKLEVCKSGYGTQMMDFSAKGSDAVPFRIALQPGGVVRGRVTDESGKPYEDIEVTVLQNVYAKTCMTDSDGRYEIRDINTESARIIYVSADGYHTSNQTILEFPVGKTDLTLDFSVKRRTYRTLSGRVTDKGGAPVAGADVFFGSSSCAGNAGNAKTDINGEFTLKGISPEKSLILVKSPGLSPTFAPVNEGGDQRIDVVMGQAHSARGKVVDGKGNPVRNANISVSVKTPVLGRLYDTSVSIGDIYRYITWMITTDSDGSFLLKDLPSAGAVLSVYSDGLIAPDSIPVKVDSNDNVITMQSMPQLAGKALDAITGLPVRGLTVKWDPNTGCSTFVEAPDGIFRVPLTDDRFLDRTECQVKVSAKGFLAEEMKLKMTDVSNAVDIPLFKLHQAGPIKGRVVDPSGKGVPGAEVTIYEKAGILGYGWPINFWESAYKMRTITDADGNFSYELAREKIAGIVVQKAGFPRLLNEEIDVTKPLVISLAAPASIEIRAQKFAAKDAQVRLMLEWKPHYFTNLPSQALSDDGRLVVPDLGSGNYSVMVDGAGRKYGRAFALTAGQKEVIDLDTVQPVTVKGRVTRGGKPVPGMQVLIDRGDRPDSGLSNANISASTTDSKGQYEIPVERPGKMVLKLFETPGEGLQQVEPISKSVVLKPGDNTFDFSLPSTCISGKVVSQESGKPLSGEVVIAEGRWDTLGDLKTIKPQWGRPVGAAKTGSDGSFRLFVPSNEEVVLVVNGGAPGGRPEKYVGTPFAVDPSRPASNITMAVSDPGELQVELIDKELGKPLDTNRHVVPVTLGGRQIGGWNSWNRVEKLPPGRYVVWVWVDDGRHPVTTADVEIKAGKTAKVRIEVPLARQRIVFKFPKASRFVDYFKSKSWGLNSTLPCIEYKLKDVLTGKSVLNSPRGLMDSESTSIYKVDEDLAIPVKPGTYKLEAQLQLPDGNKILDWKTQQTVTVKPGKDTIIEVK